ncbi:MAG: DUF488 domain-containing protein [Actinobacteria bacterium]|nr:DUF488 domain-containing protein [Actinomycetota bacterium]
MSGPTIHTIGHGTRAIEAFLALLGGSDIERVTDVRSFPGSRRHPQFGREALAASLAKGGIAYEWMPRLGGFREARPESPHIALPPSGFRGYADHMETEEFREALQHLIATSGRVRTTVMCAESLWTKCHRRYLADALTAAGCVVLHIVNTERPAEHRLSPAARLHGPRLIYDVGAAEQPTLPESAPE